MCICGRRLRGRYVIFFTGFIYKLLLACTWTRKFFSVFSLPGVLQKCCHCHHPSCWNHDGQGVSRGGGSTFFYAVKRAAATTFTCFLPRNDRWRGKIQEAEEDQTQGKGDGYGQTETGNRAGRTEPDEGQDFDRNLTGIRLRTDRTTVAYRQSHSCNPAELWLHLDGTEVTAGRNCSFNRMELKFQPDGTGWNSLSVCSFIVV